MRRADWEAQLARALQAIQYADFRYGVHDCCLMVAFVLDRICCDGGFVERMRAAYTYASERDAARLLVRGGGLRPMVSEFLGEPHPTTRDACRGDVALVMTTDRREAIGIVLGDTVAVANAGRGFALLPAADMLAVWRV